MEPSNLKPIDGNKMEGSIDFTFTSPAELNKMKIKLAQDKTGVENADAVKMSESSEFDAFRIVKRIENKNAEIRNEQVTVLAKTPGAVADLVESDIAFKRAAGAHVGDWRVLIKDPDVIVIVRASTRATEKALTPDFSTSVASVPVNGSDPSKKVDLDLGVASATSASPKSGNPDGSPLKNIPIEETDAIIARQQARFREKEKNNMQNAVQNSSIPAPSPQVKIEPRVLNAQSILDTYSEEELEQGRQKNEYQQSGKEVSVNTFSAEEQEAKKKEWLQEHKEWILKKDGVDLGAPLDIDLNNPDVGAPMKSPEAVITPEERKALEEMFTKNAYESMTRMEKISAGLKRRLEGSTNRLKELGVTGLPKALEMFKNVKPRYKIATGVLLAGASVATGGFTSVLSTGLSTASYSSGFYTKMLQAEQAKNPDVRKEWIAARATAYGLIAALGTGALIGNLFSHVDVTGAIDSAVEKASGLKDALKDLLTGASHTAPHSNIVTGSVVDMSPVSFGDSLAIGESAVTSSPVHISPSHVVPIPPDAGFGTTDISAHTAVPEVPVEAPAAVADMPHVESEVPSYAFTPSENVTPTITQDPIPTVATPLHHPISVPTLPENVLLDGSGNPVLDSSGNFIKTGGGIGDRA